MDLSRFLYPAECPEPLRKWADGLYGERLTGSPDSKRGIRRVVGWRWDGTSDEIALIVAPQGYRMRRIPPGVWSRMRSKRG